MAGNFSNRSSTNIVFKTSVSKKTSEPGAMHFINNIRDSAVIDCQNDTQTNNETSAQTDKAVSTSSQNLTSAKPEIIYITQKTQTNVSSCMTPENSDSNSTSDFQQAGYIQTFHKTHPEKPTPAPIPQSDVLEEMKRQIAQRFIKTYTIVPPKEEIEDEKACYVPGTDCEYRTPGASFRNKQGRVKRPMNAFMVWARDYRAKLAEAMPNATNAEVSIKLGQLWANLPEDEKATFYQKATEIKLKHREDFPGWVFRPSPSSKTKEVTSPKMSSCVTQHLPNPTSVPSCPVPEMGPQMPHPVVSTPSATTPVCSSMQMNRFPVYLQRVQCLPSGRGIPQTAAHGVPQKPHILALTKEMLVSRLSRDRSGASVCPTVVPSAVPATQAPGHENSVYWSQSPSHSQPPQQHTGATMLQSPIDLLHSTPVVKTVLVPSTRQVQPASYPANRVQYVPYPGRQMHTVRCPTAPEGTVHPNVRCPTAPEGIVHPNVRCSTVPEETMHPNVGSVKVEHPQESSTDVTRGSPCIQVNRGVDATRPQGNSSQTIPSDATRRQSNSSLTIPRSVETIDVTRTLGIACGREKDVESPPVECSLASTVTPEYSQEDSCWSRKQITGSDCTLIPPKSQLDTSWPFPFPEEPSDSWTNEGGPPPMYRKLLETHDPFQGCDWLYSDMYPGGLQLDVDRWLRYLNDDESPTKNESLSCFHNDTSSDDIQVSPLPLKSTLARLLNAHIEESEDGDVIVGNLLLPEDETDNIMENIFPAFADIIRNTDEKVKAAPISSSENVISKSLLDGHSMTNAEIGETEDNVKDDAGVAHIINPTADTLGSLQLMNTIHLEDEIDGKGLLRSVPCSSIVSYIGGGDGGIENKNDHVESNASNDDSCLIDCKGGDCRETNKRNNADTFLHHEGMPNIRSTRSAGKVPQLATASNRRTKEPSETIRATPCRRHRTGVSRRIK